ncbi:MAG TPA: hypothetical protein VK501_16145 [Baekduia sp.]|uniref:hypothetical protein n=1 Tax=Baekduia sp. TaxID=2600305 RepID=UPI002B6F1ADE|nr:hypothetical protein [Baekduia sp.]HMJ35440.1 hypothetical protein [Baekduia sp.]
MTRLTRRLVVACAAATALAALGAPAALAADHTQRLDIGAELVRQQAGGKPWIVNLSIGAELGMSDGSVPAPISHMRFSFTRGAKVHPDAFATCAKQVLDEHHPSQCPSTSVLGTGTAVVNALETVIPATLKVFNGPATKSGRKLFIYANALGTVTVLLEGTLKKSTGRYGWVLDVPVEKIQIVGDQYASITGFSVSVGGIGRKGVPFIEAPTSCAKPGWPFLGEFDYSDGSSGSSSAIINCLLKATNND